MKGWERRRRAIIDFIGVLQCSVLKFSVLEVSAKVIRRLHDSGWGDRLEVFIAQFGPHTCTAGLQAIVCGMVSPQHHLSSSTTVDRKLSH